LALNTLCVIYFVTSISVPEAAMKTVENCVFVSCHVPVRPFLYSQSQSFFGCRVSVEFCYAK